LNFEDEQSLQSIKLVGGTVREPIANEEEAISSLIWVVSINETVGANGEVANSTTSIDKRLRATVRTLEIRNINVSIKKEAWGNGKADIAFVGMQLKTNNCLKQDEFGIPFAKVSDNKLNTWFSSFITSPTSLTNGPNVNATYWEENEEMLILFYEEDRRKKFETFEQLSSVCSNSNVSYCSKETKYGNINPIELDFPNFAPNWTYKTYPGLVGMEVQFRGAKN
jgi:hypothetical protein